MRCGLKQAGAMLVSTPIVQKSLGATASRFRFEASGGNPNHDPRSALSLTGVLATGAFDRIGLRHRVRFRDAEGGDEDRLQATQCGVGESHPQRSGDWRSSVGLSI